jgi:hypothetical protein
MKTSPFEDCQHALDDTENQLRKLSAAFYRLEHDPVLLAAPELLEALKLCKQAMGLHGPCRNNSCPECIDAFSRTRAAIAKAEGRES